MDLEETLRDGKTAKIVMSFQHELKSIKDNQPELAAKVDAFGQEVRELMQRLRASVDEFPETERELVGILVINGIHTMVEEVFL